MKWWKIRRWWAEWRRDWREARMWDHVSDDVIARLRKLPEEPWR